MAYEASTEELHYWFLNVKDLVEEEYSKKKNKLQPNEEHEDHSKLKNCGVLIASGSKDGSTKMLKIKKQEQEDQETFENFRVLFDEPIDSNIKKLHNKMCKLMSIDKEIHGLEAKIHALLREGEDKDIKNDEKKCKKSFLDWLKECNKSELDDTWGTLKELKIRAVNQGINLSHLVIDLMFLMSPKINGLMAKLQVLENSLKWVLEGEKSVVIWRIVGLLDAMKEFKKVREYAITGEVLMILQEGYIDSAVLLLLKEILRLECFWSHRKLPDRKIMSRHAFQILEADIKKCEEALKEIESEVEDLIDLSEYYFGEGLYVKESDEYEAMNLKINECWSRIEESEKEK